MSAESGPSGYEHAGGYKPPLELEPLTLREILYPLAFTVLALLGDKWADKALGRHTPGHVFTSFLMIVVSIVVLVLGALLINRGRRPGAGADALDSRSVLDPVEIAADPARQRRKLVIGGVVFIIVALAMFAYALSVLMSAVATS